VLACCDGGFGGVEFRCEGVDARFEVFVLEVSGFTMPFGRKRGVRTW
jgi:hypothetical protein